MITNGDEKTLDRSSYKSLDLSEILSIQIEKYHEGSSIFVLNTATLIPLELSYELLKRIAS